MEWADADRVCSATKYKNEPNVIFGVMNEVSRAACRRCKTGSPDMSTKQPHDLDVATWATTLQWVVNTIRSVGATSQMILLPGTEYGSAFSNTAYKQTLTLL